jgi:hypothetical protein
MKHGNLIHVVKLFQLVSPDLKPIQFELVHQLPETQRGAGAFGSNELNLFFIKYYRNT